MKIMKKRMWTAILAFCGLTTVTSCSDDDDVDAPTHREPVVIRCVKPDYLKQGDKVALISPS